VLVFGLALSWVLDGGGAIATEGDAAPDFSVELFNGATFSLQGHLEDDGRPVLLNLWASWCAPCREEIPALSDFAARNPGIAVIGVAVEDTLDDALAFAVELEPSYPLGLGGDDFETAYPNFGLPVTYFIDADGVIREVFNGILTEDSLQELIP
jgi:thiol-disulfide isomerase/thioredoxin